MVHAAAQWVGAPGLRGGDPRWPAPPGSRRTGIRLAPVLLCGTGPVCGPDPPGADVVFRQAGLAARSRDPVPRCGGRAWADRRLRGYRPLPGGPANPGQFQPLSEGRAFAGRYRLFAKGIRRGCAGGGGTRRHRGQPLAHLAGRTGPIRPPASARRPDARGRRSRRQAAGKGSAHRRQCR